MAWWRFVKATKIPTPGAMSYALETNNQVPRAMIGPAIAARTYRRAFVPSNLQTASLAAMTGVGGLATGQVALQPLSDPYNYADSGS